MSTLEMSYKRRGSIRLRSKTTVAFQKEALPWFHFYLPPTRGNKRYYISFTTHLIISHRWNWIPAEEGMPQYLHLVPRLVVVLVWCWVRSFGALLSYSSGGVEVITTQYVRFGIILLLEPENTAPGGGCSSLVGREAQYQNADWQQIKGLSNQVWSVAIGRVAIINFQLL